MNTNLDQSASDPLKSVEHYEKTIHKLQTENESLNKKIGNLFFIYQTISKMFNQLTAEQLVQLAVEGFSDFTSSQLTTLFMKNDDTEAYDLVMQRSIKREHAIKEMSLYPTKDTQMYFPTFVDLTEESQRDIVGSQFYNGKELVERVNPHFIIAIKFNNILKGFVTIGNRIDGESYDKETIEIIESLGRALSVVFSTENNFYRIKQQKSIIDKKLKRIMDLNTFTNTVNSATSIEIVVALILSALSVSYNANLAFFALYDDDKMVLEIQSDIGMKGDVKKLPMKGGLLPLLLGEKIIEIEADKVNAIFEDIFLQDFMIEPMGACIIPIYIKEFDVKLIGAIGLLGVETGVLTSEQNITDIEFLANHIAPIIFHINHVDEIKACYHPDYYQQFIEALKTNMDGVDIFNMDLYVLWVSSSKKLQFSNNDIVGRLFGKFDDVYCVDNQNTLLMTTDKEDIELIKNLLCEGETMQVFRYKEDFQDAKAFMALF